VTALWIAAGVLVAVIAAKVIRDLGRPSDPESPYDV
jgi:hypothetical protein